MSQGSITYTDTFKASFLKRFDQDGKVWIEAIAHDALTAKTPYAVIIDEFGQVTAAIGDDTNRYYVGVPESGCAAGDLIWLQIGGECSGMITPSFLTAVGIALRIHDGAIELTGTAFDGGPGEFAVATEASTASFHDVILRPELVLGSQT
jgi:hypothetical protein